MDWKTIVAGGGLILVLLNQGCAGKALATAGVVGAGAGAGAVVAGGGAGAAAGGAAAAAAAAARAASSATRPQGQHFAKPKAKTPTPARPTTAVCTGATGLLAACPVPGVPTEGPSASSGPSEAPGCSLTMTMQPRTLHGVDADKDGRDDTMMMPVPGCS